MTFNNVTFLANSIFHIKLPVWRSRIVLFILFLAFLILVSRAFWLQGISTKFLQKQGAARYVRTIKLPATRGKITDRNGQVLALSIPVKAIWAIPEYVQKAPKEKLHNLAKLLAISEIELYKKLNSNYHFVYLKRQVKQDIADKIIKLGISGIETCKEYKRFYPAGEVTAHLVGFTDIEDIGQDGMELSSQKILTGIMGSRRVIKDRLGRIIENIEIIREPQDGKVLTLSIDNKIQYIAFSCLQKAIKKNNAKSGSIIVIDTNTGEVLASVNFPTYNPNDRLSLFGANLRNRVLTDTFEPGSTFKPFTVALALDTRRIEPTTVFQTELGQMTIDNMNINDTHAYGPLTVTEIIQKSSNIGTAKIALKIPPREMWNMFNNIGLGKQPKFGFPGAVSGRLRPYKLWRPIEQATMSYGYGISLSLMQLAHAYLIFARNGDLIPLSFQKLNRHKLIGYRVISKNTALQMRHMLESVVSLKGTGQNAQIPGYRVGGKTGTAYKIFDGQYVKKYIASFVGIVPISNPRLVIAVMLDEPNLNNHYGGTVAGPVFASVATNALHLMNVPPDFGINNVIVSKYLIKEKM